jgi:hypothetical protein
MRSVIVGLCGDAMQRLTRFASERPWLCGTAMLAMATAGLFAWFSGERWDQVDVAAVPQKRPLAALTAWGFGEAALAAEFEDGATVAAAAPDAPQTADSGDRLPSMSDFEDLSTRERITFRSAARPTGVGRPEAAAGARGAWLIGTIEEIDDEFRHAAGGQAWPGLASHPGAERW